MRKRRIRRVLILTPASLRTQWQQEMKDKFSLGFEIVEKTATHKLQRFIRLTKAAPLRSFFQKTPCGRASEVRISIQPLPIPFLRLRASFISRSGVACVFLTNACSSITRRPMRKQ